MKTSETKSGTYKPDGLTVSELGASSELIVTCSFCRNSFRSIGMGGDGAEHNWVACAKRIAEAALPFAQHDWMDAELEDDNCKLANGSGPITVGHWRALRVAFSAVGDRTDEAKTETGS